MKVRLYKYGGAWTVDQFTLYFPYPKWLRLEERAIHGHDIRGCFVGCNQDSGGGVIRCCWDYDDRTLGYCIEGMGRRYPLERMSAQFRKWARRLANAWNDAIRYNDAEHWEVWNKS